MAIGKHKWWEYIIPGYGMYSIVDSLFGKGGLTDSVRSSVSDSVDTLKSTKNTLQDIFNQVMSGINGFDFGSGINSLLNYYSGGVTASQLESQRYNAEQADLQRQWEEEMSNTAFQRQTADMQSAGVNPALMYGGVGSSGASTPSGASASGSVSGAGNLLEVLYQMAKLPNEKRLLDAQARKEEANARKSETEADVSEETKQTQIDSIKQGLINLEKTAKEIDSRISANNAKAAADKAEKALKETLEKGEKLENFFKAFRKGLIDEMGIDPDNAKTIAGLAFSICSSLAREIVGISEDTREFSKEQRDKISGLLDTIASAFGKEVRDVIFNGFKEAFKNADWSKVSLR